MCKYNIIYFFRTTAIPDFGKAEWNEFNQFCAKNDHIRNFEIIDIYVDRFKEFEINYLSDSKYADELNYHVICFWWPGGHTGLVAVHCMHAELLHKLEISWARKGHIPLQDIRNGIRLFLWHLPEDSSCNMC